jgi:hypothetical protein
MESIKSRYSITLGSSGSEMSSQTSWCGRSIAAQQMLTLDLTVWSSMASTTKFVCSPYVVSRLPRRAKFVAAVAWRGTAKQNVVDGMTSQRTRSRAGTRCRRNTLYLRNPRLVCNNQTIRT